MSDRKSSLDFLEYPCEFPLKVVGKTCDEFENTVLELIRQHVHQQHPVSVASSPSKKNTYTSITLTFEAQSRQQLETIYQCLYDCPHVVMTL